MAFRLRPWLRLTAILSFSLLLMKSALAAQITAEPTQGPAGMIVTVRGTEWTPGNSIEFSWDFNYYLTVASIIADVNGEFTVPIRVPSGAPQVLTYIDAGDQVAFQTAQAPFTVNSAFAGSDDYPEPLCPLNPPGWSGLPPYYNELEDPWAFFNRECTSFVAWRLNTTYGFTAFKNSLATPPSVVPSRSAIFGNAGHWYTAANALGIGVDGNPAPGDVAWFAPGAAGASSTGHVAWVEGVNPDGTITIEDYNWHEDGFYRNGNRDRDHDAVIPVSDVSQLKFIHFGDWVFNNLQTQTKQRPVIVSTETFREGVLVFFRLFFTDPNDDAIGFGFRGTNGSGWAKETHPFSSPSYGRMSGSTPIGPNRQSTSIAIEYPFNLQCDTQSAYASDVEAWIYDRAGLESAHTQIHLSCSTQGTAHVAQACTR